MIVTLTINRTISVDRLALEDRAYINSSRESAGGRGINALRVIHTFGGETMAVPQGRQMLGHRLSHLRKPLRNLNHHLGHHTSCH